jgi:DNA-binding GntR family transcriptional regulator
MPGSTLEAFIGRLSQGHYFPGQRLTEQSIIEDFQISRGNARLLLQNLRAAGIVEIHKHKGASIRRYTDSEIGDIFLIRQRLEGLAARLAAEKIDEHDFPGQVEFMKKVLNGALDEVPFRQVNKVFHEAILELSQSAGLRRVIESMVIPMLHIQIRAFVNEGYEEASKQEHRDIAAAILERNADAADSLMQAHIHKAGLRIRSLKILAS